MREYIYQEKRKCETQQWGSPEIRAKRQENEVHRASSQGHRKTELRNITEAKGTKFS